jgi:2,5-diketo-D-gluconate reductase A
VVAIAQRHGRTPAQVLLRWNLELGNVVVSKSVTPTRIQSNSEVFGFVLSEEDRGLLSSLDCGHRTGPDPAVYGT